MSLSTADLYDAGRGSLLSVQLQMHNYGGHEHFSGPIQTIECFEDNALLKETLSQGCPGSVLVVDGKGSLQSALVGDMIAGMAVENGWAGLVIYGAVRDSAALSQLPIGVKALGTNPRRSTKTGRGSRGGTLRFAGVTFNPGASLFSDADGILVEEKNAQNQELGQQSSSPGNFSAGVAVRREVMGDSFVEAAFAASAGTDSEMLQRHITENVWGALWTRDGLDRRSRSLATLAALIAIRAHDELRGHVRGALRNGLTRTEIVETVAHISGYAGAPAGLSAMKIVRDVLESEVGPLTPTGTPSLAEGEGSAPSEAGK